MRRVEESQLEKRFRTTTVYKRSRPYFDITRLNRLEHQQELSRRKPSDVSNSNVTSKFSQSFYSADLRMNERVQTELSKYHSKTWKEDMEETETFYTTSTRKGKTLDMNKMLPREHFKKIASFSKNQNNFCNFQPYLLPHNHCVYFEKGANTAETQRVSEVQLQQLSCEKCKNKGGQFLESIPSITEPEVGKTREKLIFDESLFRTLVDFKKYDKQKSERREQKPLSDPNLQKIRLGEALTHKTVNLGLLQFYHGDNKWTTPQMDARLTRHNEYSLKHYNKQDMKKMEWTMQKRKLDLIENRRLKILGRKRIRDVKGEYCDQKFFRRNYL